MSDPLQAFIALRADVERLAEPGVRITKTSLRVVLAENPLPPDVSAVDEFADGDYDPTDFG